MPTSARVDVGIDPYGMVEIRRSNESSIGKQK